MPKSAGVIKKDSNKGKASDTKRDQYEEANATCKFPIKLVVWTFLIESKNLHFFPTFH